MNPIRISNLGSAHKRVVYRLVTTTALVIALSTFDAAAQVSVVEKLPCYAAPYPLYGSASTLENVLTKNRFVRLDTRPAGGQFHFYFDRLFGGTPMYGCLGNKPFLYAHPGAGFSVRYVSANDPTGASANGWTPHPVARSGNALSQSRYGYYLRETVLNGTTYEVTGFLPAFWLSHEDKDDAIAPWGGNVPTQPSDPSRASWKLRYTCDSNDTAYLQTFSQPEVPIWFQSIANATIGMIFLGDEQIPTSQPWNRRLAEIRNGRIAAKIRVNFKDAPNGFGGLVFRREVPSVDHSTIHTAYAAPGYSLNVNASGRIELLRTDHGGAGTLLAGWNRPVKPEYLIEVRTYNFDWDRGRMDVFADDVFLGTVRDETYLGRHAGLIASAPVGQSVRFSDRQIFDVGIETVARYTVKGALMKTDITIGNAGGVSEPHKFYVAVIDPWANKAQFAVASPKAGAIDDFGQPVNHVVNQAWSLGNVSPSRTKIPGHVHAGWIGNAVGNFRLWGTPIAFDVMSNYTPDPHMLASDPDAYTAEEDVPSHISFNALPFTANTTPLETSRIHMTILWGSTYGALPSPPKPPGLRIGNTP